MIVLVSVVIVPPNERPNPNRVVFAPTVIPASSMTVPIKVVFAPKVVAAVGVQKTLHADAPLVTVTVAPAVVSRAPCALKINVPFQLNVNVPPTCMAHTLQYTHGV